VSKNKQVSNKPVPHQSPKMSEKLEMENSRLHAIFYATHTPALYAPKGALNTKPFKAKKSDSNGSLAKQWNCTERHVSKVRSGRGTPQCTSGCNCPNAVKLRAAQKATGQQPNA